MSEQVVSNSKLKHLVRKVLLGINNYKPEIIIAVTAVTVTLYGVEHILLNHKVVVTYTDVPFPVCWDKDCNVRVTE